jgi:ATP-dependent Lon protease
MTEAAGSRGISKTSPDSSSPIQELPTDTLAILPLEHFVLFPFMIAPIVVGDERSKQLIDEALVGERLVGVLTRKPDADETTSFDNLFSIGTAARIIKMLKMPDGTVRILLHGVQRIGIAERVAESPYLRARLSPVVETAAPEKEALALTKNVHTLLARVIELASLPEDLGVAAMNLTDPGKLADLVASNLSIKVPEQQEVLELADVKARLQRVLVILSREIEVLELGSRIQSQVKTEMDKGQREYLLREQMKVIRKELGEDEGAGVEMDDLRGRIAAKLLPDTVRETAERELRRLGQMPPSSPEYTVSRTYLDWILDLPWKEGSQDSIDLPQARTILDEDHYDLEKVKERILEYLSVRKLKNDMKGPILCFVGPPGTGKTSLGRSIARAMSRKFYRLSLGGMRDEAEIRGHRRTYIGAMPGRVLKGLKQVGANNPVFMLDEVDKLGSDYRGDPSAALLEVLDPEQNNSFTDNYLDMPFDLSKIMFITTANWLDPIPGPLRDRMEIIELSGYTQHEKLMIARKYIIPKQMAENGITERHIRFTDPALRRIIEDYTREAGLRNIEREIGNVCRKIARKVAEGATKTASITAETLRDLLGPPKFFSEVAQRMGSAGVAIGLAWTSVGGEILFIEVSATHGSGRFTLTGQLGDVMKESAQAALTYLHSNASRLGIHEERFQKYDLHVHIPAGAIPKDGPSAGITLCTAMASLLTGRRVKDLLAMTGEITLTGNVLPVGGIKEKLLAASHAGIREVIMAERNRQDIDLVPKELREKMSFHFVRNMSEVLVLALEPVQRRKTAGKKKALSKPKPMAKRKPAPKAAATKSKAKRSGRK